MGEQNEKISKNQYREGYVSFDIDELKQIADEGTDVNAEAYGYIYEALKNTSDPNIRRRGKKSTTNILFPHGKLKKCESYWIRLKM